MRRGVAIVFSGVAFAALLAGGCASRGELDSGPTYPEASLRVETLDIHAFREGTRLRLTNTTGRSFGPSTGQPRPAAAQHYGVDNALAPGTPISARIRSIDVRVNAVFETAGFVFYHALAPYTLRMYRSGWRCYADANQDGTLNIFDYLSYQNTFMVGDPYADCDSDGRLTIFDFLCYQNAYDTGEACP